MPKEDKRSPWQKIRDAAAAGAALTLTAEEVEVIGGDWGVQGLAEADDDRMKRGGSSYVPSKRQSHVETKTPPPPEPALPPEVPVPSTKSVRIPSSRQLGAIKFIERVLDKRWKGETFEEANEFIGRHFDGAKRKNADRPPSDSQLSVIKMICQNFRMTFKGTNSEDAYHFISENIEASKAARYKNLDFGEEDSSESPYDESTDMVDTTSMYSEEEIPF